MYNKFYRSNSWIKKRKQILKRDNNECQRCKGKGGVGKGETVHHIKHLIKHPELALVDSNLITLCFTCHNEMHPEKFGNKVKPQLNEEKW